MFKTKLKSFSILEVTFSLLVTALIIGIIYVLFDLLTFRLNQFKSENTMTADFNRFSAVFSGDMQRNSVLEVKEDIIALNGFKNDSCLYVLNKDFIIRTNHEFIDTFHIKINSMQLDTVSNTNQSNIYQRLTFEFDFDHELNTINYHKRLYPTDLLKNFKVD